jgi:hypothetical protein
MSFFGFDTNLPRDRASRNGGGWGGNRRDDLNRFPPPNSVTFGNGGHTGLGDELGGAMDDFEEEDYNQLGVGSQLDDMLEKKFQYGLELEDEDEYGGGKVLEDDDEGLNDETFGAPGGDVGELSVQFIGYCEFLMVIIVTISFYDALVGLVPHQSKC